MLLCEGHELPLYLRFLLSTALPMSPPPVRNVYTQHMADTSVPTFSPIVARYIPSKIAMAQLPVQSTPTWTPFIGSVMYFPLPEDTP